MIRAACVVSFFEQRVADIFSVGFSLVFVHYVLSVLLS